MKKYVLESIKKQLHESIDKLDYHNIEETEKVIYGSMDALSAIGKLPDVNYLPVSPEKKEVVVEEQEQEEVVEVEEDNSNAKGPYRFERKIKGGFINEITAFVPETLVRELNLRHGDLVYAEFLEEGNPPRYRFSVAEHRHGKDADDRVQLNQCIVEYDASINRYVVNRTASGENIRMDGVSQTLLLPEDDVKDLGIKEGDIVDIAYPKSNSGYRRIIWRYSVDESEGHTTPRPSSYYKKKDDVESEENPKPIFKNKIVCAMGYEPGKASLREEVEKRGGEFLWLSGREALPTLQSTLAKSDAVVLMLGHVGHAGTIAGMDFCKRNGIPCGGTHKFGRSGFVEKAAELLELAQ